MFIHLIENWKRISVPPQRHKKTETHWCEL